VEGQYDRENEGEKLKSAAQYHVKKITEEKKKEKKSLNPKQGTSHHGFEEKIQAERGQNEVEKKDNPPLGEFSKHQGESKGEGGGRYRIKGMC